MIETDAFRAQACSTNFSLSRAYEKLKLIGWFAVPAKTRWNEEAAVKRFSVPAHYIQEVPESSERDARTLAKILDKAGGLEYRARRSHCLLITCGSRPRYDIKAHFSTESQF